jgi:2-polyprenyl-6-methoxyphenol hydroxylase-like FAD-dependent oxidoreductase
MAHTASEQSGTPDQDDPGPADRHAVVIGGSVAGLLAAHVLLAHYDRVTIVERDRFPDGPEPRAGVPQSRHTHLLLEGGQRALEELLPGIGAELDEHGAPRIGMPADIVYWEGGRWYRRTAASTHLQTGTRPLLEWLVRRRVLADPRLVTVQGTEVVGLLGNSGRVEGIRLRERGSATHQEIRELAAGLVVDASGRGSRAPDWLTGIGAEPAKEETVDAGLAYSTCLFSAGEQAPEENTRAYFFVTDPEQTDGAVAVPTEDGRYLVTLSALRGSEPPSDEAGFLAFASRLPHPVLHEWLLKATARSPVHAFRATSNVRRRYDRPGNRPPNFLAVGDALCSFNPVYAQGVSVASLAALALRDTLGRAGAAGDRDRAPVTDGAQRAVFKASRQAWDISSGADKEMPGATGDAVGGGSVADKAAAWYLTRVQQRATGDPVVGNAFRSVLTLTAPITSLFAPRVARAVLFGPVRPSPAEPPTRPE